MQGDDKASLDWIIGFVEADGCFGANKNKKRKHHLPFLTITQKDKESLEFIRDSLGMGDIHQSKSKKKKGTYWVYTIYKIEEIIKIIRLFDGRLHTRSKIEQLEYMKQLLNERIGVAYRRWDGDEELTLTKLLQKGLSDKEIGEMMDRSPRSIETRRLKLNFQNRVAVLNKLKELRKAHNLTQAQLATKAGVDIKTVKRIEEHQESIVQIRTLKALAGVFNYSLPELLAIIGDPQQEEVVGISKKLGSSETLTEVEGDAKL